MPALPHSTLLGPVSVVRHQSAVQRAAHAAKVQPDALADAAHAVESYSGPVAMTGFLGIPILGAAAWAVGKAGDGIGKLVPSVGSTINKSAQAVSAPLTYLEKTPLGETRLAPVAGLLDRVFYKPFVGMGKTFNRLTGGLLEKRAVVNAAKMDQYAITAMAHANQLAGMKPEFSILPQMVRTAIDERDVAGLTKHMGEISGHATGSFKPSFKAVEKYAARAVNAGKRATGLSNMAHGVSDAADMIKKTSIAHTAANTAFVAGGVASAYLTAKDIGSDLQAYSDLLSDMTGKPAQQFGMYDMFLSDAPYAAKLARNSLLINAGPRAIAEAANTVLNLKMLKGHFTVPMMALQMAFPLASQGIGLLTSGNVLDAYKELKATEMKGERNTPEAYAKLLGLASEELNKQGGENSQFTKALAEVYAQQNVSVRDVMRAVATGKVMQDLKALQAQYAAQAPAAEPEHHHNHHHSHVEALAKKRELPVLNKPRETLGTHTQNLIEQAGAPHLGGIV